MKMTAMPCVLSFLMSPNSISTSAVSREEVGSSSTIILQLRLMARAMETICCVAVP